MSSETPDNMRKAYIASLVLEEILTKTDPLNIFAVKTEILYELMRGNTVKASKLCEKLSYCPDPNGKIKSYTQYAMNWIEVCRNETERRYVHQQDFHYEGNDIWMQILHSYIQKFMEADLMKNISGSKAVVFVEGETDVLVLNQFAAKLFPSIKISFIDIEGYTNYQSYIEAKMTRELRIPCYIIFDGDTKEKEKEDLINRFEKLSLSREFAYTLRKNSIEDYLLIPRAIKHAYPDISLSVRNIEEFLQKAKNKKNKKILLRALFKKGGLGAYNKNAASLIASKIEKSEIETELVQLLARICNLQKLQ